MNEFEFRLMCREVSKSLGLPDVHLLGDFLCAVIDGMPMSIVFNAANRPDRVCFHFDLGEVPGARRAHALEQLLRLNLQSGSKTTGVFALEPLGWRAVYAVHLFHAQERAPAEIAQTLRDFAAQARAARAAIHGQT